MSPSKHKGRSSGEQLWLALKVVMVSVAVFFMGYYTMFYVVRGITGPFKTDLRSSAEGDAAKNLPAAIPTPEAPVEKEAASSEASKPPASAVQRSDSKPAANPAPPATSKPTVNTASSSAASKSPASAVQPSTSKPAASVAPPASGKPGVSVAPPASPRPTESKVAPPANSATGPAAPATGQSSLWRVHTGRYSTRDEAAAALPSVRESVPGAFIISDGGYRIQVGAFATEVAARNLVRELAAKGLTAEVVAPN